MNERCKRKQAAEEESKNKDDWEILLDEDKLKKKTQLVIWQSVKEKCDLNHQIFATTSTTTMMMI
jgi:prolyl oligopeptidase PreP (S9A serine peptidase family)